MKNDPIDDLSFEELALRVRNMIAHTGFHHDYERDEFRCLECRILKRFDKLYSELWCHHQHPMKPQGVTIYSHLKSEPFGWCRCGVRSGV